MPITNDFSTPITADSFFVDPLQQQQTMESSANSALAAGISAYQRENYTAAIQQFRASIGMAPHLPQAVDTAHYMASAYLKQGNTEGAIKAYEEAINLDPSRDDSYIKLGNLYYSSERYDEAEEAYAKAVKANPQSTANRFSLGQAQIKLGHYRDAEDQFRTIERLAPRKVTGSYGLGLTYSAEDRYEEAVAQFQKAVDIDDEFYDGWLEMGYAYADMGNMDKAQEVFEQLEDPAPELADLLTRYMYKVDTPKFATALSDSDFPYTLPPKTLVAGLDSYLVHADNSKTFKMIFQFDKEMDRESVEDRFNWSIKRSTSSEPGGAYNFGLPLPDTEVKPPSYPDYVYYDAKNLRATVYFKITQNSDANGTIDPTHLVFKFSGEDKFGLKMDQKADEFSGFSGIA
jgi:tetratricopeptide (TPR) repeat protein